MKRRLLQLHVTSGALLLVLFAISTVSVLTEGAEEGTSDSSATGSFKVWMPMNNHNSTTNNGGSPHIFMITETNNRQEILAEVGETVYIGCPLDKHGNTGCEWYKRSALGGARKRITQFFDRYQIITSCQLKISSVTYEDAGTIICRATSDTAEPSIHTSQLTVTGQGDPFGNIVPKPSSDNTKGVLPYSEPEIVKELFPVDHLHRAHKGDNISIKCEANGNPKPLVTWRRGSKNYTASTEGYSYLKLTNLTKDDAGDYKCEAVNIFGKVIHDLTLQVQGPLQGASEILDLTPRNVTLYEGKQGNITCIARFEADPWFSWVKQVENKTGQIINFSYNGYGYLVLPKTEIRPLAPQLYATTLLLQNVTLGSSGIYHCIVAGLQGYNHSEAHVIVEPDPNKFHLAQIRRHKAVTILWIFAFVIFGALVVLCIFRIYGCPHAARHKLSSQGSLPSDSTSSKKTTQLPKRSPETLSTDCTHNPRLEAFSPLVPHGSCSLTTSQEPSSLLYKNCPSSCGTYNSYDPEFSVASSADSFMMADLEMARSVGSCDSEFCSKHSNHTSPRTETSDYYTRNEVISYHKHKSRLHPPLNPPHKHHHRHHHHSVQHEAATRSNLQSHFPLLPVDHQNHHPCHLHFEETAVPFDACRCPQELCNCHLYQDQSNLCELQGNSEEPPDHPRRSHFHHVHHHHPSYVDEEEDAGGRGSVAGTRSTSRRKLNPSPTSFLEQLKANPNNINVIL